ncbi:hypothetical protein MAPG_05438 [Magnaporthiopsis poae ATCC 64411]|uniref:Uncharacterized protein n=1 Tax=Magnaporthiopsis poae (strain ATCC 64411 / 73-15) TaxID=644358 RepID=A0A0C4DZE0_MAGP6|nr:hypothetical protein MAPG_05438 [Magnaporthiopsis poae ATCC 64411]
MSTPLVEVEDLRLAHKGAVVGIVDMRMQNARLGLHRAGRNGADEQKAVSVGVVAGVWVRLGDVERRAFHSDSHDGR